MCMLGLFVGLILGSTLSLVFFALFKAGHDSDNERPEQ